jgi:hypothetical protein
VWAAFGVEETGMYFRLRKNNLDVLIRTLICSLLLQPEDVAMGKTLPPFSQLIEYERRRWAPFKRALPKEDQALFDRLFDCAKLHVQAGVMVSRPWPFETIVMAVLLEQHKQVDRVERLLHELEGRSHT